MCDYSLDLVASRAARCNDHLVTRRFNSITTAFVAADEANVAVCLRPGTEIAFAADVRYEAILGIFSRTLKQRVARFRQIRSNRRFAHHDALEFPDGRVVLLTRLHEGQHATVLQLPAAREIATPQPTPEHGTMPASPPRKQPLPAK